MLQPDKSSNELAENRTELAENRTDFAEDRTLMANERTFAGWLRTGIASAGIGLGFHAIFGKIEPTWVPKIVATTFMVLAILMFYAADRKASQVCERLSAHKAEPVSTVYMTVLAGVMMAGACILIGAVWLFDWT